MMISHYDNNMKTNINSYLLTKIKCNTTLFKNDSIRLIPTAIFFWIFQLQLNYKIQFVSFHNVELLKLYNIHLKH